MRRPLLVALVLVAVAGVVVGWLRLDEGAPDASTPPPRPPSTSASSSPAPTDRAPVPGQSTSPGPTWSPCVERSPLTLTVVTLNMHAGRTGGGRLDLPAVADEVESWDADVVLLQEVDRGRRRSGGVDQATWLGRRLHMDAVYGPTRRLRPGASGNAVLSRHPITSATKVALPRGEGRFRRGLVHARLDVRGHRVDVFSTHFDHTSRTARRDQARAALTRVLRSPAPVVVGGDLNATPGTRPVQELRRGGLVDAWAVAGTGEGATAPSNLPRRRIDFVLADESFRPLSAVVLPPGVSDHRGVRSELALLPESCR